MNPDWVRPEPMKTDCVDQAVTVTGEDRCVWLGNEVVQKDEAKPGIDR